MQVPSHRKGRHRFVTLATVAVAAAALLALSACAREERPANRVPSSPDATRPAEPTSSTEPTAGAEATGWPRLRLEPAWEGLDQPLYYTQAPDGSDVVLEKGGRVKAGKGDSLRTVLDLSDTVSDGSEQGLLGIAFPPGDAGRRRAYVYYTDRSGDSALSRFTLERGGDLAIDAGSEEVVLRLDQPYANHNGGQVEFGPDGYLYLGLGDGGSSGDPQDRAEDLAQPLGKILRLDVEGGGSLPDTYRIPPDNPFKDRRGARSEVWAYGLRNPWRFSFDPPSGELWIADVGQGDREEIDVAPASEGGIDYGWDRWEGTRRFEGDGSREGVRMPVAEYGRDEGASVTGGYVYRGSRYPRMRGTYVFGDYVSGRVWGIRRTAKGFERRLLAETGLGLSSFGRDAEGELYAADLNGGTVYRLVDASGSPRD